MVQEPKPSNACQNWWDKVSIIYAYVKICYITFICREISDHVLIFNYFSTSVKYFSLSLVYIYFGLIPTKNNNFLYRNIQNSITSMISISSYSGLIS